MIRLQAIVDVDVASQLHYCPPEAVVQEPILSRPNSSMLSQPHPPAQLRPPQATVEAALVEAARVEADPAGVAPQAPQARQEQLEQLEQQVLLEVCKLHCTAIVPRSPPPMCGMLPWASPVMIKLHALLLYAQFPSLNSRCTRLGHNMQHCNALSLCCTGSSALLLAPRYPAPDTTSTPAKARVIGQDSFASILQQGMHACSHTPSHLLNWSRMQAMEAMVGMEEMEARAVRLPSCCKSTVQGSNMQAIVQMPSSDGLCAICPIRGSSTPAHAVPASRFRRHICADWLAFRRRRRRGWRWIRRIQWLWWRRWRRYVQSS